MLTLAEWLGIAGGFIVLFGIYFKSLQRKLHKQSVQLLIEKDKFVAQEHKNELGKIKKQVTDAQQDLDSKLSKYKSSDSDKPKS